jgi:hypothetical protein
MKVMEQAPVVPVFESTGQAIHVAFTIMAQPAQQDCVLRKSLIRMLDSMNVLSPQLTNWMEQLRGTPSDTVHFDGLSSYDVRAQCSLILLAIETRLPEPERWALCAKYSATDHEGPKDKRRYAFSKVKSEAIKSLSDWIVESGLLSEIPRLAMDCMVAKFYANHAKTEISFRVLAKSFGGNHMAYKRAFDNVKARLRPLELMAVQRLSPYFEAQGIVMPQDESR